ncbi:MAG: SLBB domain-containing protein [Treponema sp.]|jgi:protein involved in polysaccharide export with SLBB domain|nr:SLBB domain-containing protein [Treponema sp.]
MKRNKYIFCISIFWICSVFCVFVQSASSQEDEITTTRQTSNTDADLSASSEDASRNIMLARSSSDYRVTPGDVYTLAYAAGSTPVSYIITVDTSYRIRVSNLGIINGAGKTFLQLKSEVEAVVANNYPLSGVQLVLTQPAIFRVYVNGEVHRAGEASAWGLSRLSTLAGRNLTGYASTRDISVKSSNGQTRVYDLFKAQRFGDMSQDPYLRPGDVVTFNRIKRVVSINGAVERPGRYQLLDGENIKELIVSYGNGFTPVADKTRSTLTRYVGSTEISGDIMLLSEEELTGNYILCDMDVISIPSITSLRPAAHVNRLERTITINGAVRRPGTYELMPNENLKELIEVYADGLTPLADLTRIEMTRLVNGVEIAGDKIFLSSDDLSDNYALEHLDSIFIPSVIQLRSVLFVEGAVGIDISASLHTTNRFRVQFSIGETYASLVRRNSEWFSAMSDTQNSYILRKGERININIDNILYNISFHNEVLIEDEDTLIIPFRQYFVAVSGSVINPGRYPYIPERDWEYYIGLAGGFVPGQNANEAVKIRDIYGNKMKKTDDILPETTITAETNHFLYFFNQYAPLITTVLSVVTTFFTVMAVTR